MGIREEQKKQRRQQILDAAEEMIRRDGPEGLGMRELANDSGVSLVTPYNLFKSKRGVLQGLFERVMRPYFSRIGDLQSLSGLERIFESLELLTECLSSDSPYNRDVLVALMKAGDSSYQDAHSRRSFGWYEHNILAAIERGEIKADTPINIVVDQILLAQLGAYILWAEGKISNKEMRLSYLVGVATTLLGFATDETRDKLTTRLASLEKEYAKLRRNSIATDSTTHFEEPFFEEPFKEKGEQHSTDMLN